MAEVARPKRSAPVTGAFLAKRCPWVKHSGYVIQIQETLDWDANDIVDLNGDGRVGWMQTNFEQVAGADGRDHSFWVHKLWRIEKTSMTEDPSFIPRRRAYRIL